jgi:hypothetical protein
VLVVFFRGTRCNPRPPTLAQALRLVQAPNPGASIITGAPNTGASIMTGSSVPLGLFSEFINQLIIIIIINVFFLVLFLCE